MPGNPQIAFLRHQFSAALVTLAVSVSVLIGPFKSCGSYLFLFQWQGGKADPYQG